MIVFTGCDFPFAAYFFNSDAKFIQIHIDSTKLGRLHKTDIVILGDARKALKRIVELGESRPVDRLKANQKNNEHWVVWLRSFDDKPYKPLRVETVFKQISRIADEEALFVTDFRNTTIHAIRLLDMNGKYLPWWRWCFCYGHARYHYPSEIQFTDHQYCLFKRRFWFY